MEVIWGAVLLLLGALAVVQAVLVGAQAYEHRRFARSRLRYLHTYRPSGHTVLFIPCRGNDVGLVENLASFFQQDYDDYEIRFLVESPSDPVCRAIQKVVAEHPERQSRIVFTGKANDCGQKVHNLLRGTDGLAEEVKYLAFADSDARPRRQWLRALIHRLDNDKIGATTGYRWFIPVRPTTPNLLVTSVNASFGMLLGSGNPNIVWGGSWAIRRDRFEQLEIRRAWQGKLNDDLVVTGIMRRARLRVEYEPACAVASLLDVTTMQMINFARRQYLQARYYLPNCWRTGLLLTTFSLTALCVSLVASILMWRDGSVEALLPIGAAAVLCTSWVYRGIYRIRLSHELFPEYRSQLRTTRLLDLLGGPIAATANWMIYVSTAVGCRLVWREIHYELDSRGHVLSVRHKEGRPIDSPLPSVSIAAEVEDEASDSSDRLHSSA
jgi:hypothetical protein